MLVHLTQTFLTSPFWNPICFRFWLFLFSSAFLVFCFHCVCFSLSAVFLLCWLCFWCFCFVLFCVFVFVLLSCFAFSLWKKVVFPCKSFFFFRVMLVKRVVWSLCFYVFVLVCFSCVVSFHCKEFICIILLLCCCFFVTRLSGLLVCILWSFSRFCFFVVLFWILSFLFFHSSKKKTPQKPDTAKNQKNKKCRKNGQKKS